MKSIKEHMLNEVRKSDEPVIGNIAYDYYDEPWVIIDYCKVSETSKLKKLMRDFDTGSFLMDGRKVLMMVKPMLWLHTIKMMNVMLHYGCGLQRVCDLKNDNQLNI